MTIAEIHGKKEYQAVLLAALLHDIGKFWQRTGERHSPDYDIFTPKDYGEHGAHAKWSADFIERYVPKEWHASASSVLYHHNPQDRLSKIVSIADHLSASERERDPSSEIWQLQSIFTRIRLGEDKPSSPQDYYCHLNPLNIEDRTIFPSQEQLPTEKVTEDYHNLWDKFFEEHKSLFSQGDFSLYFTHLYNLLRKYTWCIPSAGYKAVPDIPLFDHSRTTCSLASCLWLIQPSDAELSNLEDSPSPLFWLIGGDISGIQDYLYNIANVGVGGVAKRLRARSFYLSCLVEVVAHRLLHSLVEGFELPFASKIMSSGGKFVLLAPKLPQVEQSLRNIEENISRWLFKEFQGELTMLFAKIPLAPRDFQHIAPKLTQIEDALNYEKVHKLSSLLSSKSVGWNKESFLWKEEEYHYGDCPSCRKMPVQASPEEEVDERFCSQCVQARNVGERLTSISYIAYSKGRAEEKDQISFTFFDDQPYSVTMVGSEKNIPASAYLVETLPDKKIPLQFPTLLRPLANHVPRFENEKHLKQLCQICSERDRCEYRKEATLKLAKGYEPIYSFECIAAASRDEELYGSELLGILKGDVDHLGFVFSFGFELERKGATLSCLATLSRQLDLFFSGWIDYTLRTKYRECYTVYSGGDDFMFVGPWDKIIDLAHYINTNFTRFVADNKNITLSAGIAVTKPKFPIVKSSQMANDYLEKAKDDRRNRLHLFGITVPWTKPVATVNDAQVDFAELEEWAELLQKSLDPNLPDGDPNKLTTAFVHRLLGYSEQCREWLQSLQGGKPKTQNLLYMSHLAYDIARNIKDEEGKSEVKEKLVALTDLNNNPLMSKLRLPITWALLKLRR